MIEFIQILPGTSACHGLMHLLARRDMMMMMMLTNVAYVQVSGMTLFLRGKVCWGVNAKFVHQQWKDEGQEVFRKCMWVFSTSERCMASALSNFRRKLYCLIETTLCDSPVENSTIQAFIRLDIIGKKRKRRRTFFGAVHRN